MAEAALSNDDIVLNMDILININKINPAILQKKYLFKNIKLAKYYKTFFMEIFSKNINQNAQNKAQNQYYYNNNYNNVNNNQNYQKFDQQGKIAMTMMSPQTQNLNVHNQNLNNINDIDPQIILKAMNQSYTQRMSGAPNVQLLDILALVSKTAEQISRFSMLKFGKIEDVKYFWRIVEVDESSIFPQSIFFSLKACQSCQQQGSNLKLYQLLMSLDGKQLRLQSMQDRNKCFNVNFDTIECKLMPNQNNDAIIILVGNKYQIKLFVTNATIPFYLKDFLNKLQLQKQIQKLSGQLKQILKKSIQKSRGFQFSLQSLLQKQNNFFKKRYATEQQFTQYCQTGDVLLFKDSHTFAQIQRAVTNSQYDHVGIVYRSQKYGICIFQSSSAIGVSLAIWTHLIRHNWFKGIQSISWRRLLIHDKPKDYEQEVTSFINQNLNKKFDISVGKLMRFRSKIGQQSIEQQKNKTYFCSELVATLYKKLGLLDSQVSATQYWPKHFSDKGHISMLKNSALEHQRELIFQQKILKENYKFYK